MVRLFLKERPYIIHSHTPKAGTVSMLAGWVARVPHRVHTVAGLPLTEATGLKRWLLIEIEKVTLSCATNVLVNSTQLSEFMIKTGLCDTSKLKVLGHGSSNGIDTDFFFATSELRAKAKTIRQSLGIPAKSLMFCFVGRMVADKGLDELISAFVSISKECSAYLLLVGPFEEDLDPLTSESRRLNVGWMATTELSSNQRTLLDWKTQCV